MKRQCTVDWRRESSTNLLRNKLFVFIRFGSSCISMTIFVTSDFAYPFVWLIVCILSVIYFNLVHLWTLIGNVNLSHSRITWEGNFNLGMICIRFLCEPGWGRAFWLLFDVGASSLVWVEPFPGQYKSVKRLA